MNSSITRYPQSASITGLAVATRAIEAGFIAAGVTVCVVAAFQSFATVLNWIAAL